MAGERQVDVAETCGMHWRHSGAEAGGRAACQAGGVGLVCLIASCTTN